MSSPTCQAAPGHPSLRTYACALRRQGVGFPDTRRRCTARHRGGMVHNPAWRIISVHNSPLELGAAKVVHHFVSISR